MNNVLYIGIDPSISCTAIMYEYNGKQGGFYSAHNLKEKNYYVSENIYPIVKQYQFWKNEFYINSYKEKYNLNFISGKSIEYFIKSYRNSIITKIINKNINDLIENLKPEKIFITYEDYSYSSGSSGLLFDIAEFNKKLKDSILFSFDNIELQKIFCVVSPLKVKKMASGSGKSDKYGMYKAFIEKAPEGLKNEFIELFKPNELIEDVVKKGTVIKEAQFYKNGKLKRKEKIQKQDKINIYEKKEKGKKLVVGKMPMADLIDAYFIKEYGKKIDNDSEVKYV